MVITRMAQHVIEARILASSHAGDLVLILRLSLDSSRAAGLPFTLWRRQFPVRLAFAMTINKSQGQSLQWVGLYLREPVFAHGQLYVAFSRCTDARNLWIALPPEWNRRTDNIVYSVKWVVRMMEIRWMSSDVNRPSEIDGGRRGR